MSKNENNSRDNSQQRFKDRASEPNPGLIAEFWEFFRTNKKWWMIPIVVMLLVFAGLFLLSGTALAPFIYTLF